MEAFYPPANDLKELLRQIRSEIQLADPATVEARLGEYLVVDVREPCEVLHGFLPGAVHVPRGMLELRACRDPRFADRDRAILAYSGDGRRSMLATWTLRQLGFTNVQSLDGGFRRWARENRPIE